MNRAMLSPRPRWVRPPGVDEIRTAEDLKQWWKNTGGAIVGTSDPRSMMEVALDTVRFLMNDPSVPYSTRLATVKWYVESLIGKAEVRVHSTGDGHAPFAVVFAEQQERLLEDPEYREKVLELEAYEYRSDGGRRDEPGEVRPGREPGPVGDEAPPRDPQPADDRPGGAADPAAGDVHGAAPRQE